MRTLLCPGDNITYACAFSTSTLTAVTWWSGSGFTCPANNPPNIIQLTQSTGEGASLNTVPASCGNLSAVMTNISGGCYTSVLTIPTPQYFNGTTVMCRDGSFGTLIGNDTLNIQLASPPSVPTITSLISTNSDQLTVTWTYAPTATSYSVSTNDSVNTLVLIPSTRAPQYTFTGLTNNTVYTVSVVAINCAGSSSPATMTNRTKQLPTATNVPNTTIVPTLQPSTSSSNAVAIGVGVGVGFVVLLLLVGIAAVVVILLVTKKGSPATPKGDNYEQNEIPLPPKNTDKAPSKPEGLIYADIGLPSRVPMQAPNPPDLNCVAYSTVGTVNKLL
ncbi:hypothetical protein EMCRGX_G015607 [Ephydatia muelleri]